jgi:glycosyl transferase, family 25
VLHFAGSQAGAGMKAHIISLPGSTRRAEAGRRAAEAGIDLHFFDAVDAARSRVVADVRPHSAQSFVARYGRAQTPGELACLLSHRMLYQKLASEQDTYVLILEDDFIPLTGAGELAAIRSAAAVRGADVVILGYAKVNAQEERAINMSNPLMEAARAAGTNRVLGYRCLETTCGALSYMCSRRFLEIMADTRDYGRLADDWAYHRTLGLRIMHVAPLCFREDYLTMASSLEGDRASLKGGARLRLPPFLRPLWRHGCGTLRRLHYLFETSSRTSRSNA